MTTFSFKLLSRIEDRDAYISPCELYRYWLSRRWGIGKCLYWVMLNPSTATAKSDDPTIRKCIGFAKHNGFDAIYVVNLFAWRSTDPRELPLMSTGVDIVGPENDAFIRNIPVGETVVAAWGGNAYQPELRHRHPHVISLLDRQLYCVKKTGDRPWHPLYVKYGDLIEL